MMLAAALIFAAVVVNGAAVTTPQPPTRVVKRASTCTPVAGHSSSIDDTPAIQSAIASCPSGTIVIPSPPRTISTPHLASRAALDALYKSRARCRRRPTRLTGEDAALYSSWMALLGLLCILPQAQGSLMEMARPLGIFSQLIHHTNDRHSSTSTTQRM